jgi:hypothetical protein
VDSTSFKLQATFSLVMLIMLKRVTVCPEWLVIVWSWIQFRTALMVFGASLSFLREGGGDAYDAATVYKKYARNANTNSSA